MSGRGGGTDVRIYYHPAAWTSEDQMKGLDTPQDNIQPDDVLFHELFHAHRFMLGLFEEVPTEDTWAYSEEAYAIIATNLYVSELGRGSSLRGDHDLVFHSLKDRKGSFGDQTNSMNFYNDNFKLVDDLIREMPDFVRPLEKDGAERVADWNPFRDAIQWEKNRSIFNTAGDKWDMMST